MRPTLITSEIRNRASEKLLIFDDDEITKSKNEIKEKDKTAEAAKVTDDGNSNDSSMA